MTSNRRPGQKPDAAFGIGAVVLMTLCCAGPLLVAGGALGVVGRALGNPALVAAGVALAVAGIALVLTRRRHGEGCVSGWAARERTRPS